MYSQIERHKKNGRLEGFPVRGKYEDNNLDETTDIDEKGFKGEAEKVPL